MRKTLAVLLLASCASPAFAAPAIPPILTGAPTAAQIDKRCDWFVAESERQRTALEASKGAASVATTLAAFDKLTEVIGAGQGEAGFYREVSITPEAREAGEKCEVRMSSEGTKLSLSRPIYERIKAIKAPADEPTRLYLTRVLGAFERSGIALDDAGPRQGAGADRRSLKLTTEFEANIPKGQRTITATAAELDGLPQDFIDAHKPGADGKITLKTDYTDYLPVLTYAKSSDLRQRFYREYQLRAYPLNDDVLRDLINKRDELAKLVGRPNYATLNFEDRMLNTPEKVQSLLDEMMPLRRPPPSATCEEACGAAAASARCDEPSSLGQHLRQPPRTETVLWLRPPGGAQLFRIRQCPGRHSQAHAGYVRRRTPPVEHAQMGQSRRSL